MKKPNTLYFPIILAGFAFGAGAARLYYHDMWAFLGFTLAGGAMVLVHMHTQFINKLLLANHIMGDSLKRLIHDLQEAGIEIMQVTSEGDVETHTAKLVRKDVH